MRDSKKRNAKNPPSSPVAGVIVEGYLTPRTRARVEQACDASYPASKISRSEGSTLTPRRRPLGILQEVDVQWQTPKGSTHECCATLFSVNGPAMSLAERFKALDNQVDYKSFGPFVVKPDDLARVPARRSLRREKAVMQMTAEEIWRLFVNKCLKDIGSESISSLQLNRTPHLCHLVPRHPVAAVTNTQDKANLVAGSAHSNWTSLRYENQIRDMLKKNQVAQVEIRGEAEVFDGSCFAKNTKLHFVVTAHNGRIVRTSVTFDSLQTATESAEPSSLWANLLKALLQIDVTAHAESIKPTI